MGLMDRIFTVLFGNGANVVRDTAEVFRQNAEAGAAREAVLQGQALAQHGAEFSLPQKGLFDRFMDAVNRLPRPAMALGTLGLFVAAMVDPVWFAARMRGLVLVPDPLWWLMGAIVSFYFGARFQVKGQEFQRSIAESMLRAQSLVNMQQAGSGPNPATSGRILAQTGSGMHNAALEEWRRQDARRQDR